MDVYVQKLKIKPPPGGVGRAVGVSAALSGSANSRCSPGQAWVDSLAITRCRKTGEILTISILHQRTRQVPQLRSGNESHSVSNFFRAGNLHALTLFDRLDKRSSVNERFKCSRIEPCEAASHPRDFECPGAQVLHVQIRDLISNSPRLEGFTSAPYRTTSLS